MATLQVRFTRKLGLGEELAGALQDALAPDPAGGPRLRGRSGFEVMSHFKSDPSLARPDLVGHAAGFAIDPAGGLRPVPTAGMVLGIYQVRPETAGSVHASGADPSAPPVISPRYLATETDRRAAGRWLLRARELLGAAPLAEVVAGEDFPSALVPSAPEAALEHSLRYGGAAASHAVGSCAMGPGAEDVLDPELRVRGVDGLRVVDASALPFQLPANSAAPVMVLAWLAADLLD